MSNGKALAWSIHKGEPEYLERAAQSLRDNGFCVLHGGIVPPPLVGRSAAAIWDRLDVLLRAAHEKGLDVDGLLRFNELCKRQPGARYDLRLPLGDANSFVPFGAAGIADADAWCSVKPLVDAHAVPILRLAALGECEEWAANVAGSVVSLPGAPVQPSHLDGESPLLVNAFVPLVAIDADNGPTELQPGSQDSSTASIPEDPYAPLPAAVAPCLSAGDLLLFQYRTLHRGLANTSAAGRPILCQRSRRACNARIRSYCHRHAQLALLLMHHFVPGVRRFYIWGARPRRHAQLPD